MSHHAQIRFKNDTLGPRIVWVEPWGEDYTLFPGQWLEIVARGESEVPRFDVVEYEEGFQVWVEGCAFDYDVLQDGARVECGHQRQAALDAGLKI
jgi:hypothetical protein